MEDVDVHHFPTPPETPIDLSNGTKSSSVDDDGQGPPFFVRRSARKRSATDFFFIPIPCPVEDPKPPKRLKTQKESAVPTSKVVDSARRSLVFSEATPQKTPLPPTSPSSDSKDQSSVDHDSYPIGSLVWAKLKGYDWWPGRVSSPAEVGMDQPPHGSLWVRWYGEKQVSDVKLDCIEPLVNFQKRVLPQKLKGSYKKGVFLIIKEAARRSGKVFTVFANSKTDQLGTGSSEDHSSSDENPDKTTGLSLSTEKMDHVADSEGGPRRTLNLKYNCRLSSLEEEMLQWALEGFLPLGGEGFKVTSEDPPSLAVEEVSASGWPDQRAMRRAAVGRVKNNNDTGILLEPPPKRTPFLGPIALREMITVPGGRIDTFDLVREGKLEIQDVCLGCGHTKAVVDHPLFVGGICQQCKESFMECVYLFDDDGTQMYCSICSAGDRVYMCDKPNCARVYCGPCIKKLCGQEELEKVEEAKEWFCYMCRDLGCVGLLKKQEDWGANLHLLYSTGFEQEYEPPRSYAPIPPENRQAMKVLALFDGIATGMLVLKDLGMELDLYISSEVDPDAIKVSRVRHPEITHVGSVENITEKQIREWGPFHLVIGGSPCNDLSIVNPARKGIYDGTGRLFFEFFRILSYCKPREDDQRPFFWLFENVVSMRAQDKNIISRFLQCNPVIVDAREISAAHRARYFWGNFPGMTRPTTALPGDRLSLQDCLEQNCSRIAQFDKLRTITTKMNSIKQTKKALMPVKIENEGEDVLWCTEMERLFGFPDHYTDVANLGRHGRQKLLGRAWSVPVIRHIFSPLKEFFKSSTQTSTASEENAV